MNIGLPIAAAAVAVTTSPVWEQAPRWICRAEQMHTCKAYSCTNQAGIAVFQVDFSTGAFHPIGSDKQFIEHVISKRTYEGLGFSKINLDSGDSVQFSLEPEIVASLPTKGRKFSSSRGMFPEVVSYFGTCYPE